MSVEIAKVDGRWPEDVKIHAMTRAAFIGITATSRELGIPHQTLKDWCYHPESDYGKIRERELAARKQFEIEQNMEAAAERRRLASEAAVRLEENIDNIDLRDLPNAIRNLDTGAGIYTDKAQRALEEGRPVVHVTADVTDVVKTLIGEGVDKESLDLLVGPNWEQAIDVEGEEVEDGES